MESRPPLHIGVVAIEKGAFGSPLTSIIFMYTVNAVVLWKMALAINIQKE